MERKTTEQAMRELADATRIPADVRAQMDADRAKAESVPSDGICARCMGDGPCSECNADRRDRARHALKAYIVARGDGRGDGISDDPETDLQDMITDALHYLLSYCEDPDTFEGYVRMARMNFDAERSPEDSSIREDEGASLRGRSSGPSTED